MKKMRNSILGLGVVLAGLMSAGVVLGQAPQGAPPMQGQKDRMQPTEHPVSPEAAAAPVNAEEDASIKAFREAPMSDIPKKLQAGEDFLAKYPQSRYRGEVYNWQVKAYLAEGQVEKMEVAGEKDLELMPTDAQTMAILGSAMPRTMNNSMTAEQRTKTLVQAEGYSKKALELAPTMTKPAGLTDEQYIAGKNQIQAMAYSGLGLVAFRRNNFAEAIPNLEQAVKYDPNPDPVNYFLLGVSNEKASHFDDAIKAFTKCAEIQSSLAATCKTGIDEAKKLSTTQLSVPK